jgi:hypothetical protein
MVGGGGPDRGKCTVEVVVDDVAQVEIRGTTATLRTMSGQPAQWRRFECTGPVPQNAANFRFAGVDGRGRQELVRDPRNGGAAVIQIEDKDGGAEGYTFDITWGGQEQRGPITGGTADRSRQYPNEPPAYGNQPPAYGNPDRRDRPEDRYRPDYRDSQYYRRFGHGFTTDEAVRVCQQSIMAQATRRFRGADIHFDRTAIDDQPGRQDWVTGAVDVHRGPRGERYGFACSVNFDNGVVRSADLDMRPRPDDHDDRRYR